MAVQEAQSIDFKINEDLIMWNLCGRNEIKRILTVTKPNAGSKSQSDQRINQSEDRNSPQERSVIKSRDDSTDNDRLAMIDSLACKTFPPEVQLCWSSIPGYRLGVMATTLIPQGVWIGPYEGKLVKPDKLDNRVPAQLDGTYLWEIFHENHLLCYVDGSDINTSSWMRFIQCARSYSEQNLNAFQYQDSIYYRVVRDIHPEEELLVWYDDSYPQYMGIPLMTEPLSSAGTEPQRMWGENKMLLSTSVLQSSSTAQDAKKLLDEECTYHSSFNVENHSSISNDNSQFKDDEVFGRKRKHEENLSSKRNSVSSVSSTPMSSKSICPDGCGSDDGHALKCGQCSKNFSQRATLQMHLCAKQTNSPYQCGHCNLLFTNPSDLRSHVVKHVREKPFKCGFCMRSFVGSTTLNNHVRIHTGGKPFNCNKCGVTFCQGAQYARHIRLDCNGNLLANTECKS